MAIFEGLLSFCNGCRNGEGRATGRASKASDKCSFAKVVETERVDATGREERQVISVLLQWLWGMAVLYSVIT